MFKKRENESQEVNEWLMREEKRQMSSMSEKELMVEILIELKKINSRIDDIEQTIKLWSI